MRKLLSALIVLSVQLVYSHSIIYVNTSAGGSDNGTSWSDAYTILQSGLNAAISGDQIWVAAGTYNPTSNFDLTNSSRYYHFRLIDGVEIYGGFAGTESGVSERTNYRTGEANETILSGDIGNSNDNSDNCYHVIYHPDGLGLTASAVLDGFTIQDGNANGSDPHIYGGGIYSNSNVFTIRNCTIQNNEAKSTNVAHGGGVVLVSSDINIENSFIISNSCSWDAGGIYIEDCSPTIVNSVIANNSGVHGGGVYLSGSANASFVNVTIANNTTSPNYDGGGGGGGIWAYWGADAVISNSIIWGNTRIGVDNDIALFVDSEITLNHSCYNVYYSEGTFTTTNNNITDDPQFIDALNSDFRIKGISPCVDTGYDTYNSQSYDIRGSSCSRKLNKSTGETGTIDMGAYEYKLNTDPLPVELDLFTAALSNNCVDLQWQTATEVNNYGFEIERLNPPPSASQPRTGELVPANRAEKRGWVNVGFVAGYGNSNSPKRYEFIDEYPPAGNLQYRLKQINTDGSYEYYGTIAEVNSNITGIDKEELPTEFLLSQNYPNPFNPTTTISYSIPALGKLHPTEAGRVETSLQTQLRVYNILGREVATLVNGLQSPGNYTVEFDGSSLPSGVYIYNITSGNYNCIRKMSLIK